MHKAYSIAIVIVIILLLAYFVYSQGSGFIDRYPDSLSVLGYPNRYTYPSQFEYDVALSNIRDGIHPSDSVREVMAAQYQDDSQLSVFHQQLIHQMAELTKPPVNPSVSAVSKTTGRIDTKKSTFIPSTTDAQMAQLEIFDKMKNQENLVGRWSDMPDLTVPRSIADGIKHGNPKAIHIGKNIAGIIASVKEGKTDASALSKLRNMGMLTSQFPFMKSSDVDELTNAIAPDSALPYYTSF